MSLQVLGPQLHQAQYNAFCQVMSAELPALVGNVQTGNSAGKFFVNGTVSDADLGAIRSIYEAQRQQPVSGYDIMAQQSLERRRKQTYHARAKRQMNAIRFHRG